ncbi:cadherin-23-like [Lucilia sericata]|uniref:cadherin-23-like n=1 Tax=Lucilia sericata TaxID=13632 RepID=UPI0018A837B3|nr:cadherin-23-like [Lucilia sericata]
MFSVTQLPINILLIIIILILSDGNIQIVLTADEWQEPYFIDPHTAGIQWQTSDTAVGVQTINVREELVVPYKLAKINYNGTSTPLLGAFDIGDNSLLGARLILTDNQWFITIEKRQDFENPQQRIYFFQIYIKDVALSNAVEPSVLIKLENIFDNPPTLTYAPSPCRVEELHSNYISDCIFTVYDPDGMDRNNIRIEAVGKNNENSIFAFVEHGETTTYEKQYKLKLLQELHYEEKAIYNLDVKVYDTNNNTGDIFAILEVIDLPNRDPIWVRPLTTATFNEKEEQIFSLKAIDGDTGIDKPICYRLKFEEDYSEFITINSSTGLLHIQPIDRDLLKQQIFSFYTCAYKCDDPLWFIKNSTILIVQDINDHKPEITLEPQVVQVLESKYLTLPLQEFFIEDLDLGSNATYNVFLTNPVETIKYAEAFTMIPNSGYQKTEFSLTVTHADQLDYEDENWRNFELKITAKEVENLQHENEVTLNIELINWNDEWPIFERELYEIVIYENATEGTQLIKVQAKDRDIGDRVLHSIVGSMQGIAIDSGSGLITLNKANVFDYERQSLVMLQIQAKDSLITEYSQNLHTSYSQLQIKILDVNDETPELRMPRFIVNVTENSPALSLITDKIEARDPDSSANLSFEILWSQSYATKSGQEVDKSYFIGCFIIERELLTNNLVYGQLKINNEFKFPVDYEKYDTIFLTIKVRDLNQELNEDSSTAVLTIRIDDINDNPPQFVIGTLEEPRSVTELEDIMSTIGTIEAYDIDGAGNNNITYKIRPIGNLTKTGLLAINSTTGLLKVTGLIQCDIPKVYNLEYEVIVSDSVHETKGKINISVLDINNQVPTLDEFEQQVFIYENATTGTIVGQIKAHDNDRDSPHNSLEYTINSALAELHNLFQINTTNGEVKVNLRNGFLLDRDRGITYHYIPIDIRDNFNFINSAYGPVNQKSTFINVTLRDVNDNAPIMPDNQQFKPEFSEADQGNTMSKLNLLAEDRDEPNTPNSQLVYSILSIKPVKNFNPDVHDFNDLFTITTLRNRVGRLKTLKSLKGYYGWWQLEIEASDQGLPQQRNSSVYEVNIKPYNFHEPQIVNPTKQKSIRICYSLQEPLRPLYQADCVTRLKPFEVFDPDGGEYGDVHFEISSDAGHDKYFELVKESRNSTNFYVKQLMTAGIYNINLRAIDGGGSTSSEIRNLKIVFVDMLGNPMFLQETFNTDFTENEQGLFEKRYIPQAYDPKNEGLDDPDEAYKLYYFIDDSFHPEDAKNFILNPETRLLKLNTTLDRENIDKLSLRIKVSNNEQGLITNPNSVNYTLLVNITVNDVNDNDPKFTQDMYAAGITTKDSIGKHIMTFKALDPDLEDIIVYALSQTTYEVHGENLAQNYSEILYLDSESGVLILNSYVTNNMKGYLMFDIEAVDLVGHIARASVKIYIVSEKNRVKFVFLSDIQVIRENEKFLREQFQEIYGYEICNIDSIDDVTNIRNQKSRQTATNTSSAFITEVKVHFIHNNEAVEAYDIQRRSNDLAFISRLQNSLQHHNLILNDIPHIEMEAQTPFVENWLITVLGGLNIVLGAVAAIMIVLYILKIRSLKRQLKAFEPAEFGSVASNLNRLAGPSMNVFSVEGSNPVFNKQTNEIKQRGGVYDNETSSESEDDEDDFRDLHDDPLFEMNCVNNFETNNKTATSNFDHKILNNDFFNVKDKTNNLEKDLDKNRY